MAKGETRFAHTNFIDTELDQIFAELTSERCLKDCDEERFFARLAYFYSELNVVHPFREGNGRTIRTFIWLIALQSGWFLNWKNLDSNKNIAACQAAYLDDETPLTQLLKELAVKL